MNNYEAVFILRATLDSEAQEKTIEEVKAVIVKSKGQVEELQTWGKKKFTFLIKKQAEGFYYLLNFKLKPEVVKKIENTFKLNDAILRVLIVRKDS